MDPLEPGTVLEYAVEDSGRSIDSESLWLAPGEPVVVGEDVDAEYGARLVESGLCRIKAPEKPAKKTAATDAKTGADAASTPKADAPTPNP